MRKKISILKEHARESHTSQSPKQAD